MSGIVLLRRNDTGESRTAVLAYGCAVGDIVHIDAWGPMRVTGVEHKAVEVGRPALQPTVWVTKCEAEPCTSARQKCNQDQITIGHLRLTNQNLSSRIKSLEADLNMAIKLQNEAVEAKKECWIFAEMMKADRDKLQNELNLADDRRLCLNKNYIAQSKTLGEVSSAHDKASCELNNLHKEYDRVVAEKESIVTRTAANILDLQLAHAKERKEWEAQANQDQSRIEVLRKSVDDLVSVKVLMPGDYNAYRDKVKFFHDACEEHRKTQVELAEQVAKTNQYHCDALDADRAAKYWQSKYYTICQEWDRAFAGHLASNDDPAATQFLKKALDVLVTGDVKASGYQNKAEFLDYLAHKFNATFQIATGHDREARKKAEAELAEARRIIGERTGKALNWNRLIKALQPSPNTTWCFSAIVAEGLRTVSNSNRHPEVTILEWLDTLEKDLSTKN